jgi:hypothetical protein
MLLSPNGVPDSQLSIQGLSKKPCYLCRQLNNRSINLSCIKVEKWDKEYTVSFELEAYR